METIISAAEGRVRCEHKKVAIIGAGRGRWAAPWKDDSWCWWALNAIAQPRFDRHFELHPMAVQSAQDFAFLAKCPTPCYVLDYASAKNLMEAEYYGQIFPGVNNAVEYPLDWVLEQTRGRRYATCTFSYQIALAIAEGFDEIGLWGVDLSLGTLRERLVENPCVEYWVGLAEGRGIKVTIPETSTLCRQPYLYGYAYNEELAAVDKQCDDAAMALPRKRWPRVLQRLGAYYGGQDEARMVRAAAEMARTAPLSCQDWAVLDEIAGRLDARVKDAERAFGIYGTESA